MIIDSLKVQEGIFERHFKFQSDINLIFSQFNSAGKSTLLRLILYSLGFPIPSTKGFDFHKCCTEIIVYTDKGEMTTVSRVSAGYLEVCTDGVSREIYTLPFELASFHVRLFGIENRDVIKNILGVFYFDQEKGWTLLNRGTVIGSIKFSIEEMVRGLASIDCSEILNNIEVIKKQLKRFQQVYSAAQYKEQMESENGSIVLETVDEELITKLAQLNYQLKPLKRELLRVNSLIRDNRNFKEFILSMKLLIEHNGEVFTLKEENLSNYSDSIDYLVTKKNLLLSEINKIESQIYECNRRRTENLETLPMDTGETILDIFDRSIFSIEINMTRIKDAIGKLEKQLKRERLLLRERTMVGNKVITSMVENISRIAEKIGASTKGIRDNFLFTSDLKSYSGTNLYKLILAFRLAYIESIREQYGVRLPIIIDSPSAKEVRLDYVNNIIDFIKGEFQDHQIFIASIYDYSIPQDHIIELKSCLMEYDD